MSMRVPENSQTGPSLAAERYRALGRSRRSGEGSVTEMARLLLRDARERGDRVAVNGDRVALDGDRVAVNGDGAAARADGAPARRFGAGASVRLRPRPISARRA